jgi:hypothetical protein
MGLIWTLIVDTQIKESLLKEKGLRPLQFYCLTASYLNRNAEQEGSN